MVWHVSCAYKIYPLCLKLCNFTMYLQCQLTSSGFCIRIVLLLMHFLHLNPFLCNTLSSGGTTLNKNSIQEEIESRLKLGNVCYYSVQNLLSSSLLSKKLKIKIYRIILLLVVLYGCELGR